MKDSRYSFGNNDMQKIGSDSKRQVLNKTKSMNFIFRTDLKLKRKILQNDINTNTNLPNLYDDDSF